jgi:hypothetical protein
MHAGLLVLYIHFCLSAFYYCLLNISKATFFSVLDRGNRILGLQKRKENLFECKTEDEEQQKKAIPADKISEFLSLFLCLTLCV